MYKNGVICGVAAALFACGQSAIADNTAQAADLSGYRGGYAPASQPAVASERNFYVRGDVGIARQSAEKFSQSDLGANGGSFLSQSIADSVYLGAGLGWQLNRQFRFDLTGEYRATALIRAMDNLSAELIAPAGHLQANTNYQGNLSSYVGLINAYWDMFKSNGFTPYIGAGVGFAHHKMSGFTTASAATFTDAATGAQLVEFSNGTSRPRSQTNLAWAIMAGTSYDLSPNAKLDLGYRYINLGSGLAASTSLLDCVCGAVGQPLKLADLDAHEFRVGVRWLLNSAAAPGAHYAMK